MIERLLILAAIASVVMVCIIGLRLLAARRRVVATQLMAPASLARMGRPQLLSFSTPWCADCRYRQAPAIADVEAALGTQVITRGIDAAGEPELAAHFGVLTAPTTVILDASGRVAARNDGFAPAEVLLAQLYAILAPAERLTSTAGSPRT